MRIPYIHMVGAGNDYLYLDGIASPLPPGWETCVLQMCRPHFGVGGDGVIAMLPSLHCQLKMVMYNKDGTEGAMCGNGIRALARLAYDKGYAEGEEMTVETLSGVKKIRLRLDNGTFVGCTVFMGYATVGESVSLKQKDTLYSFCPVTVGNPHAVTFLESLDLDIGAITGRLGHDPAFPQGVNGEFATVMTPTHIKARVWERGSGETLSCGTGACAVVEAAYRQGLVSFGEKITVSFPGGDLTVTRLPHGGLLLYGGAEYIGEGVWYENSMECPLSWRGG